MSSSHASMRGFYAFDLPPPLPALFAEHANELLIFLLQRWMSLV